MTAACRSVTVRSHAGMRTPHPVATRRRTPLPCRACPTTRRRATPRSQRAATRGKYWWLRWVVIGVAVVVLAVEVTLVWDQLAKAWQSLLRGELVVGARRGGRRDGVDAQLRPDPAHAAEVGGRAGAASGARRPRSTRATRCRTTMPGGPVLSATFIYRQQRIWGASPVVASWQLVMSGALQVVGLALLGLGGAFLLGAKQKPAVAYLYPRRVHRAAAAGPGGRVPARPHRRHRGAGAVVVQLAARQARRHRAGQVAGDAATSWSRSA